MNILHNLLVKNKIKTITEGDQHRLADYLDLVKAFARLTYQSVYVIDYQTMKFEYVSSNPLFLCGYSAAEVMNMGYAWRFRYERSTHFGI